MFIRSFAAAAAVLLAAGSGTAQTATPAPAQKPADGTTAVTLTGKEVAIFRLPDGRMALVFKNPDDAGTLPDNFERVVLPTGEIAYAPKKMVRGFVPLSLASIISENPGPVALQTGTIDNKTAFATVGFTFKKTFRLKNDYSRKGLFGASKLLAPAGTIGFYAGHYDLNSSYRTTGQRAEMLCLFSAQQANPYESPVCFLRTGAANETKFISANTYGPVPARFSVVTQYGTPVYTFEDAFQVEDGDFKIAHDYRLSLSVQKWTSGGAILNWESENQSAVTETVPFNPDGTVSLPVNGGTMTLKPTGEKDNKTMVSFTPGAAAPAAPAAKPQS